MKVLGNVSVWATGVSVGVDIEKNGKTFRASMRSDEMDNDELQIWNDNNDEVILTDEERDYLTEHLGNIMRQSLKHSGELCIFGIEELS